MHVVKILIAGILVSGVAASTAIARTDVPVTQSHKATVQDYRELFRALKGVRASLHELESLTSRARDQADCRDLSPEKTVRCAAEKFKPYGGAEKAISVWQCESGWGTEPPHSDSYHGPFQYVYSTYASQQESMPDIVEWNELSPAVHDMRSNILTAVAWASRHGWGPWPNCG